MAIDGIPEEKIKAKVEEQTREQFAIKLTQITAKVLDKLEDRGFDAEDSAIKKLAIDSVLKTMFGEDESRANSSRGSPSQSRGETEIIEVPIEGGDVENPATVEREVPKGGTDPRLNSGLDAIEISRAFREGLSPEMIRGGGRVNDTPDPGEEYNPEDVSMQDPPWDQ